MILNLNVEMLKTEMRDISHNTPGYVAYISKPQDLSKAPGRSARALSASAYYTQRPAHLLGRSHGLSN
jgi:hypothetical protein